MQPVGVVALAPRRLRRVTWGAPRSLPRRSGMGMMDESEDTRKDKVASRTGAARGRSAKKPVPDAAFDIWLRRGLHQMFDDVAREPIPPELLRLIEQDRGK